jgi:hypothetical protein
MNALLMVVEVVGTPEGMKAGGSRFIKNRE